LYSCCCHGCHCCCWYSVRTNEQHPCSTHTFLTASINSAAAHHLYSCCSRSAGSKFLGSWMFGLPPAAAAAEGAPLLLLAASAGLLLVAALHAAANDRGSAKTTG
jgi:hypothetical protein